MYFIRVTFAGILGYKYDLILIYFLIFFNFSRLLIKNEDEIAVAILKKK